MLDLGRIESLQIEPGLNSIVSVMEEINDIFQIQCKERKKDLSFEVSDYLDQHMVEVDRDRLIQVLVNIVSNAIKYSLPQGAKIRVSVSEDAHD